MLVGVRRRTVILMCLAVALIGAGTYALTQGSSPAAPAKAKLTAKAELTFPAHIAAPAPEVRALLYPAPVHATHRVHKRHARSTAHRSHRLSKHRLAELLQ